MGGGDPKYRVAGVGVGPRSVIYATEIRGRYRILRNTYKLSAKFIRIIKWKRMSSYGGDAKCMQNFGRKTCTEEISNFGFCRERVFSWSGEQIEISQGLRSMGLVNTDVNASSPKPKCWGAEIFADATKMNGGLQTTALYFFYSSSPPHKSLLLWPTRNTTSVTTHRQNCPAHTNAVER
jgi:hypothetical protein